VRIRFVKDSRPYGYSFLPGEEHEFPEEIAELIIITGVAVRLSSDKAVNREVYSALESARNRDAGNR
jgi:hypothetical protein